MRNVSLKVLEKYLNFLCKKCYEPCKKTLFLLQKNCRLHNWLVMGLVKNAVRRKSFLEQKLIVLVTIFI